MKQWMSVLVLAVLIPLHANPLFENGKSDYVIVLPKDAGKTEKFAAEELQSLLKKCGKVVLPIVSQSKNKGRNILLKTENDQSEDNKIDIRYQDGDLVLSGNKSYCTLFAVYRFAEKQLGFRWLYPGEQGEFYPQLSKFDLSTKVQEQFRPAFPLRLMHICGRVAVPDSERWMLHNYGNMGMRTKDIIEKSGTIRYGIGHIIKLPKSMFITHPDYFSMIDGKRDVRGIAGCWTNANFLDYAANNICKWIEDNHYEVVTLLPADIRERCECPECMKEPCKSDRWFKALKIIVEKVRKKHPDVKIQGDAYHEYRPAPTCDVRFLDGIIYAYSDRCYIHKLHDDKACPYNIQSREGIRKWQDKGIPVGVYCYEADIFYNPPAFLPVANMLSDQFKEFHRQKMQMICTEFMHIPYSNIKTSNPEHDPFKLYRLTNYLFITLMHSPEADIQAVLKDYCNTLYGPAGEPMYRFQKGMAEAWDKMNIHLVWYFHKPVPVAKYLLNAQKIKEFRECFAQAEKLLGNKHENKRYMKEVALEKRNLDMWVKYYEAGSASTKDIQLPSDREQTIPLTMVNRKGTSLKTAASISRDDKNLYIHIDAFTLKNGILKKGVKGSDVNLWKDDHVEVFLQNEQLPYYFHFAVNVSGGTYDARILDSKWNAEWHAETSVKDDRWTADLVIPFHSLEYTGNPEGKKCLISVIRCNENDDAGYPEPVFHAMETSAKIHFNSKASSKKRITLILPEKPNQKNPVTELMENGWNINKESFNKVSSPDRPEIIFLSHPGWNSMDRNFYAKRIFTALDNGSLVVFDDSGWTPFNYIFQDNSMVTTIRKGIDRSRKVLWRAKGASPEEARKWESKFRVSQSYAYRPGPGWTVIAAQKLKDGSEAPVIMFKPVRKGMVAACLGLEYMTPGGLSDLLEFLADQWQSQKKTLKK